MTVGLVVDDPSLLEGGRKALAVLRYWLYAGGADIVVVGAGRPLASAGFDTG